MATTVNVQERIAVSEDLDIAGASDNTRIDYTAFDSNTSITFGVASVAVPCEEFAYFTQALSGGSATIDLTNMTNSRGNTVDGTGLKVQFIRFKNAGDNAMTITDGASNGYNVFGDASGQVTIPAGGKVRFEGNEGLADISASVKTIDITGTGTEELEVTVVMG